MKTIILLIILWIGFSCEKTSAQGIAFEQKKEWKQILRKARKENKLIFVDCYTSWCGPCRMMAASIFTQDTVGQFFNRNFVNTKYDVEQETDGEMIRKRYGIQAYPTLLFIDPKNEEEVFRLIGGWDVSGLLARAAVALDPENNQAGLARRFAAGEQGMDFFLQYLKTLEEAGSSQLGEVTVAYLNSLTAEQLATEENWAKLERYIDDPLAAPLRLVMNNQDLFIRVAGQQAVEYKLQTAIADAVGKLIEEADFVTTRRYADLSAFLKTADHPAVPGALATLETAVCVTKADYTGLLRTMEEVVKYNLFRQKSDKTYFDRFLPAWQACKEETILQGVIRLLDEKCRFTATFYGKADLMKWKAALQEQMGDVAAANRSRTLEKQYRQQGDDAGEWM